MTTNQRLLLATALSFLFFLFYSTVVPQPQPQNQNIEKTNQVWSTDITYIKLEKGFVYLAAIIDWHSKKTI